MTTERVLIVPDTHAPYHDEDAWGLMLKAARAFKPDIIVHMGDLADFYKVSAHSKDPSRALNFEGELKVARRLRGQLDRLRPKRKLFIEGNHEHRLRRYLAEKAPELYGLVSADQLLGMTENGWEYVPYRSHGKVGRVYFTHDTGHSGKYTTARALDTFQHSVVIGHHHALSYLVEGNATGEHMVACQFGWLGDIEQVDYMHKIKAQRNWGLGFGVGYLELETGHLYLQPVPIVKGTCCINGKLYTA